ncbi:hypothetical protein AHF37_10943 [Paragonimus kellicotti]|nr:hypothetical protein AHF37_10943 [Paragonimus kellicotti]
MVLLAASVCTKDGKGLSFSALTLCLSALVSRQFVEMTKARIEGLIVTFPKLLGEVASEFKDCCHPVTCL